MSTQFDNYCDNIHHFDSLRGRRSRQPYDQLTTTWRKKLGCVVAILSCFSYLVSDSHFVFKPLLKNLYS